MSSSSSDDDVDYHTCDEDADADYHTCDEDNDADYHTCDEDDEDALTEATGDALRDGPNTTFIQLNMTQQQFGDVTVEKATHVNQSFGGGQNNSETTTLFERIIMNRTVSHFQAWNQGMVRTPALGQVLDKLNNGTNWVTIRGSPGEGKTTVGYMALEELHRCGRQVFEVISPDEFTEIIETCPRPVIMLDDVVGSLEFDQTKWSMWKHALRPLLEEEEHISHEEDKIFKNEVTVVLIARNYVLNSASGDLGRYFDFLTSDKHVVCMDHRVKRSIEEKRALLESISRSSGVKLDEMTVDEIMKIEVPHGFPYVCRLFTTIYKENKAISAVEIFSKPLDFLNASISNLLKDTNKLLLFREMVKAEGKISKRELKKLDPVFKITQAANNLVGTYIKVEEDCFVFDHPSIYDSVAFLMCLLDPEFVIQKCQLSFIHERIRIQQDRKPRNINESRLVVFVNRSYADDLAERFSNEIMAQNFVDVLSHQAFTDMTFVSNVMSRIKTPLKSLLHMTDQRHSSLYSNTCLSLVPSSKSPELLKYIDNCPEITLSTEDEKVILYETSRYAASYVLTYLIKTRTSLDINARYSFGITPLMIAAETRDVHFVNQILSLSPDLNLQNDLKKTSIQYLCENGLVSAMIRVIDSGIDIDAQDVWGKSPLSYACRYNQLKVVELLIEKGARVDDTSLHAACRAGNLHVVELLFEKENNLRTEAILNSSLSAASEGGKIEMMNLLVNKGASVNQLDFPLSPLHSACRKNKPLAVKWLLQQGADVDSRDLELDTALHRAVLNASTECGDLLLEAAATVNIQNKEGDTALHRAAYLGTKGWVELLLKGGAKVNLPNEQGDMALHRAANVGSKECVDVLLKAGATVNTQNKDGDVALHRAAFSGSGDCVEMLLKADARVNIQTKEGNTPLHEAAGSSSQECVDVLLTAGATVNKQNESGDTALHRAAYFASEECVNVLLNADAKVNIQNKEGVTALHRAAWKGSKLCVDMLLKAGAEVKMQNKGGNTALHKAAYSGSEECVDALLKAGAKVNIRNKDGNTALHNAAEIGSKECIDVLLKARVKVNVQNKGGDTALHYAAERGCQVCVHELLKADAKVNAQNKEGDTPLHHAFVAGSKESVEVLLKAGA